MTFYENESILLAQNSGTAAESVKTAEASAHFTKTLLSQKAEWITALTSPDFYIQVLCLGLAIVLAILISILVQRRCKLHFEKHPPRRIDVEFILKPLSLLGPLLAIIFLSFASPLADRYAGDVSITDPLMQLVVAYLFARFVLLIVQSRPVAYFLASVIMVVASLRASGFISSTTAYLRSVGFDIGQFHISMLNLVHGLVILVVVFWVAGTLSRTLESYLRRSSSLSYTARELTVKFFRIFIYFVALLITLSAVGVDLTAFAVFGGALGVGIGLGLQKITANFVSGITLLLEKSIRIGDLIEVGNNTTGTVRELNIRYALIETPDGREIMIPNEELVSTRVTNWTHTTDFARVDIKVPIAYNENAHKAREIMLEAAKAHPQCKKDPKPNCWLREFGDNGLIFQLVFWIPDVKEGRNGPQSDVMFAILEKFKAASIKMPSPHMDIRVLDKAQT